MEQPTIPEVGEAVVVQPTVHELEASVMEQPTVLGMEATYKTKSEYESQLEAWKQFVMLDLGNETFRRICSPRDVQKMRSSHQPSVDAVMEALEHEDVKQQPSVDAAMEEYVDVKQQPCEEAAGTTRNKETMRKRGQRNKKRRLYLL